MSRHNKHYKGLRTKTTKKNSQKLIFKLVLYHITNLLGLDISGNRYEDVESVMSLLVKYFSHYNHQLVSIPQYSLLDYVGLLGISTL